MRDSSMPTSFSYFILFVSVHPHTSISFALFFCCVLLGAQWGIELSLFWIGVGSQLICVFIFIIFDSGVRNIIKSLVAPSGFWHCVFDYSICVMENRIFIGKWYWVSFGLAWEVLFKTDSAYLKETGVALFTLENPETCSPL